MSSYIYQHGKEVTTIDVKLTNNKPVFRKIIDEMEYKVYKLIMKNPHKNIVTVHDITKEYVDLEILDLDFKVAEIDLDILRDVQKYLWGLGIAYIDWHYDNIGVNKNKIVKLFDFNICCLFLSTYLFDHVYNYGNWYNRVFSARLKEIKSMNIKKFDEKLFNEYLVKNPEEHE